MKTIGIISLAKYPVPSVRGGAMETLVTSLIDSNEEDPSYTFHIFSFFDELANKQSDNYTHSRFFYIRKRLFVKALNKIIRFSYNLLGKNGSVYYWQLRRLLKAHHVDLLVLEGAASFAPLLKRDFPAVPILLHIHNIPNNIIYDHKAIDYYVDGYLCVSKFIASKTAENLSADKSKIHVLYNSIDTKIFKPVINENEKRQLREEIGLNISDFIVLFVGRLQPYKGIKELLLAIRRIENNKVKLLIVGNSFFAGSRKTKFIKELIGLSKGFEKKIIFTGFIPHSQIPNYYKAADLSVLPSMWDEPFGLTCLESISSGIPVIVTNSGGMPEIVNGECGILVERDKTISDKIAAHIEVLLFNNGLRKDMGRIARNRSLSFDKLQYWNRFKRIINNYFLKK